MRPFTYERAESPADALQSFSTRDNVAYLAGGTTLLDLMKLDVMQPQRLIDINAIEKKDLSEISVTEEGLRLGALVRMAALEEHRVVRRDYPVIAQSLALAASQQIRNMASLGGNLLQRTRCPYFRDTSWAECNKRVPGSGCAALKGVNRMHAVLGTSADCIATYPGDLAQALVALDATIEIEGPKGRRALPVGELHTRPGSRPHVETTLGPGELIVAIRVPAGAWTRRSLYLKIRDRESYEFALAAAAVAIDIAGGEVREARIALGGVATVPWRARAAESTLRGKPLDEARAAEAAEAAFADAEAHGHNAFKIPLGKATLERALLQAAAMEV